MVMSYRRISRNKLIFCFVLTTFVFLLGFVVGWFFNYSVIIDIDTQMEDMKIQLTALDLKDKIMEVSTANCDIPWDSIWKDKVELGSRLDILEERLGKNDEKVLTQKEFYQLVEIRTWLMLKKLREECKGNYSILLYFYTNKEDDPRGDYKLSEYQGIVLNRVYEKHKNNLAIFSFDINTVNPALDVVREIYNINIAPTIVIDKSYSDSVEIYEGFRDLNEVESYLE
jgi:hypothetical protein